MPKDVLKEYVSLRQSLLAEKTRIEKRLHEINAALGTEDPTRAPLPPKPTAVSKRALPKRIKNPLSLKAAILKVTSEGPKTKQEIFEAVKKLGYRFAGKDPMNSIGVVLYGKPKFKNKDGKFSPPK